MLGFLKKGRPSGLISHAGHNDQNWIEPFEQEKQEKELSLQHRQEAAKEAARQAAHAWLEEMEVKMAEYMSIFPQEVTFRFNKEVTFIPSQSNPGIGKPDHRLASIQLLAQYKDYKEVVMNMDINDKELVARYLLGEPHIQCKGAEYTNSFSVERIVQ